ncbi:uncharacterized protein B0H18DRAFT_1128971 [Fomitopsis serialis]|uniref:uncharacterized protein n=1 Tax=Fomitopsis serialis TaxID=139415 RepID=UPI00200843D6|nr:uncharacterized protein B0H18DRAFT_1128971 [Neoantrodia serialis]KAH9911259.1 hypothetical protein B0H18DRAFT_1128971 [Neoantrodia serialis]
MQRNSLYTVPNPRSSAGALGKREMGALPLRQQGKTTQLRGVPMARQVKHDARGMGKRVTRSDAAEQASENPRTTRSTKSQGAGGSKKNTQPAKRKASEAVAKKKTQEMTKEKRTEVRKNVSKMMDEENKSSTDEELPKAKKKKRAVMEDEEVEDDEQDKAGEGTPEDVEMDDHTTQQRKAARPKPKPAYGKFARPKTSLDPAEEDFVGILVRGRREARGDTGSSSKRSELKSAIPKSAKSAGGKSPHGTAKSAGGKSPHGTAKPKALSASGKDKGKGRATDKDDAVSSEHELEEDGVSDGEGKNESEVDEDEIDEDEVEDEDEGESGDEAEADDVESQESEDEGDVILVSETKAKPKPALTNSTGGERDSRSRAKVTDLPVKVRTLVSAAQNCLRLRIALNSAWTKEASVASIRLPKRDVLISDSVRNAYDRRGTGEHAADIKAAFRLLEGPKKDKKKAGRGASSDDDEDPERAVLRANTYAVVWTCASQTRNELKRKAKQVIEQTFKLGGLSVAQRTEVVVWLLETHPTVVNDVTGTRNGTRNIANFVFGGVEYHFDRKKNLDRERTRVEPTEPFRNECIPELVYQYYGLAGRGDANINAALDEFSKVPFNLIALACNAIEAALMEVVAHNQSIFFSSKLFAGKWDGTMAILETLEERAGEYLKETQELIWKHISNRLNAGPNAVNAVEVTMVSDEEPRSFIPMLQLRASKPQSSGNEPAGMSKAATKPSSSTAKKGSQPTTTSTAGRPSSSSKSAKTQDSSQAAKNPPSPSRKTRGAGASTSMSRRKHRRRDSDGSDGGEVGGQGETEDEGGVGVTGEGGEGAQAEIDELHGSGEDPASGTSTNGGA